MGENRAWRLGEHKTISQWEAQMKKRGWTVEQIGEAVEQGQQLPAQNLIRPENSAVRYVHPTTGRSVVIDEVTREVLHVGGDDFKY